MTKIKVITIFDYSISFYGQLIDLLKLKNYVISTAEPNMQSVTKVVSYSRPQMAIIDFSLFSTRGIISVAEELINSLGISVVINISRYADFVSEETLRSLGISACFYPPYNIVNIVKSIEELSEYNLVGIDYCMVKLEEQIKNLLDMFCFSCRRKGYRYIFDAVKAMVLSEDHHFFLVRDLYPEIAKRYGVSEASVERCIRVSIQCAWKEVDPPVRNMLFNSKLMKNSVRPTNGELICIFAEHLKMESSILLEKIKKEMRNM